jgi:hypothetical protein
MWHKAHVRGWLRTGLMAPVGIEFFLFVLAFYCFFWGSIVQFFLIIALVLWMLELVVGG